MRKFSEIVVVSFSSINSLSLVQVQVKPWMLQYLTDCDSFILIFDQHELSQLEGFIAELFDGGSFSPHVQLLLKIDHIVVTSEGQHPKQKGVQKASEAPDVGLEAVGAAQEHLWCRHQFRANRF